MDRTFAKGPIVAASRGIPVPANHHFGSSSSLQSRKWGIHHLDPASALEDSLSLCMVSRLLSRLFSLDMAAAR